MDPAHALAALWRASRSGKDERERALEVGLAAALGTPEVWPRLAAHFDWPVPRSAPARVQRQRVTEDGRTDLHLHFHDAPPVVLELKFGGPPEPEQVARYAREGARVIGIASYPRTYGIPGVIETVSWSRVQALTWPGAPLPWLQLRALLETMGVVLPSVDVTTLSGLYASWGLHDELAGWTHAAAERCVARLGGPGRAFHAKRGRTRRS